MPETTADLHPPNRKCRRAFAALLRKGLTQREAFDRVIAQGLYFVPTSARGKASVARVKAILRAEGTAS